MGKPHLDGYDQGQFLVVRAESPAVDSTLVGRTDDLAALRRAFERAGSGQAQVVVIEGEAGMGKSALLEAFLDEQPTGSGTCRVWTVRCDAFEQDDAYGSLGLLLGETEPIESSTLAAGRLVLSRLGTGRRDGVTVLAVDDAQWIDRPSAQAIRFALRRLRADNVLTVVTRRPDSPDAVELLSEELASSTTLLRQQPLDASAVRDLARRTRRWEIAPDVASSLFARTGGVPLLVAAVLRGAPDQSSLATDIPATVEAAALRMLGSVDTHTRSFVEASAVLAEPADVIAVGQVADSTDPSLALATAVRAGLLRFRPPNEVEFAHALLRDATYRILPPDRRLALHARAADWTTGDRRLAHRAAAADRPDASLAADLVTAAETARSSLNFALAATHRLRARSVTPDPCQREQLLPGALIDRVDGQDLAGARDLVDPVRRLGGDALRSLALGLFSRETGQVAEARALLRESVDLASVAGDRSTRERAALALAILHLRLGEGDQAVAALAPAIGSDDPEIAADALTTKSIGLYLGGHLHEALQLIDPIPAGTDQAFWEADLLAARGMMRMYAGRLSGALTDLDAAIGMVDRWRPSTNHSRTYVLRSATRFLAGDWDGAAADAATARALAEGGSEAWSSALASAVAVDVPAHRGQWSIAEEHLATAQYAAAAVRSAQIAGAVAWHAVELAGAQDDHARVLKTVQPLLAPEHLQQLGATRYHRRYLTSGIYACVRLGRLAEADRYLADYADLIDHWPGGAEPTRMGWLRGQLAEARHQPRAAARHYAEDLADPHTSAVPYLHAQLLHVSGNLQRSLGNRRAGIDQLLHARDIFTDLRAMPMLRTCEADLAVSGLTSAGPTDALTLTEREEDVAGLVVRGHTNKEVAAELFLTEKTVEYHLSKIYSKLAVGNRQELRRLRTVTRSERSARG